MKIPFNSSLWANAFVAVLDLHAGRELCTRAKVSWRQNSQLVDTFQVSKHLPTDQWKLSAILNQNLRSRSCDEARCHKHGDDRVFYRDFASHATTYQHRPGWLIERILTLTSSGASAHNIASVSHMLKQNATLYQETTALGVTTPSWSLGKSRRKSNLFLL